MQNYPTSESKILLDKPQILIVDDDRKTFELFKIALENKYELTFCSNELEIFEQINFPFSAAIINIKLETKNEFKTIQEIKNKNFHIPIIFHSDYKDSINTIIIKNEYKPFAYVIKEENFNKLLDTLESAVQYFQQINQNLVLAQTLDKLEHNYRDLVENSPDIIFSLDENWRLISINESVTQILRYPVKEILNKTILNLEFKLNNPTSGILEKKLQELTLSQNTISFNCDLVTKFGEPKEMHLKLRYVNQKNGHTFFGTATTNEEDILLRICESESQIYKLGNYLTHVDIITQRLANYSSKYCTPEILMNLKLCIRELIINAMEHGNLGISFEEKSESLMNGTYIELLIKRQRNKTHADKQITVEYSLTPKRIEVKITDEGEGFDHQKMLSRSINQLDDNILGHGRGIALVKNYIDSIVYNEKGNSVHIIKNFI